MSCSVARCLSWQDVTVANPPTLLLLVESLLQGMNETMNGSSAAGARFCGKTGSEAAWSECTANSPSESGEVDATVKFLRKAHPLLDQWMRWLLITQRPGAKGWGDQENGPPLGAFQVRKIRIDARCFECWDCIFKVEVNIVVDPDPWRIFFLCMVYRTLPPCPLSLVSHFVSFYLSTVEGTRPRR